MVHFGSDLLGRILHDRDIRARARTRRPIRIGRRRGRRVARRRTQRTGQITQLGVGAIAAPIIAGGARLGARVAPRLGRGALALGQEAVRRPLGFLGRATGFTALTSFVLAGGLGTIFGRAAETGAAFAESPAAGVRTAIFGAQGDPTGGDLFTPASPEDLRLFTPIPVNGDDRGGIFNINLGDILIPAGIGGGTAAAILALGSAIRRQRPDVITQTAAAPVPIGAVQPEPEPAAARVGAPALEMAVPDIKVQVKPQITILNKPKQHTEVLNILQSSS